jgi:ligand-binding sensor domain-containing protein
MNPIEREKPMKSQIRCFLVFIFLMMLSTALTAQYANWVQYTNGRHITAVAQVGGFIWVGTTGGLVKVDTTTLQPVQFFNTANSGLPSNDISALTVDNQGNIWIGTKNKGLARYNGSNFAYYRQSVIGSDIVNAVAMENDTIWVGTNSGAAKFDQTGWTRYTRLNSLPSDTVTSIAFGFGVGWFGTAKGILEYENRQFFNQNANLPDQYITSVSVWPDTPLSPWVGMQNNGVAHYLGTAWNLYTTSSGLPSNLIQSVAVDVNGQVLAGTPSGLGFYDGNTWTVYNTGNSSIPDNNVTTVLWANTGNNAFIGTIMGLDRFSLGNNQWTSFRTYNSELAEDVVHAVSVTSDGTVRAGSTTYLATYNGTSWTQITPASLGIQQGGFSALALDASGNPWIGTEGQGVFHYTGTQWINYSYPATAGFPENTVRHIAVDGSGNVWIGTYGGVGKYNGSWTTYAYPTIPSNVIQALAAGSGTNVWISDVQTAGLVHYDGSTWTPVDASSIGITPGSIQAIWISETGDPWIGTSSQGIATYTGGTWQSHSTAQNSILPSNDARFIQRDLNNNLWIGTSNGLAKLTRPATFTNIYKSTDSGLPANTVWSIAVGPDNKIYAATDSGLAVYSGFPFQGVPSLQMRPTTLAFGSVVLGDADTLSVVVKNTGTADLIINLVQYPAGFSYVGNLTYPDTLAPGDSVQGSIRFAPIQAKAYRDTIKTFTNAPTSRYDYIVTGTGVSAGTANLQLSPASLAFGNVLLGNADTLAVVSTNTGTADLIISEVQFPAGFSYSGSTGSPTFRPDTLAPGDFHQGSIRFAPTQAKAYRDTIKIFTNAPTSRYDYIVTGTGVASGINQPYLTFPRQPTPPYNYTNMFGYDTLSIGRSKTLSTYIKNTGTDTLHITSMVFIVNVAGIYSLVSPSGSFPKSVPANDSMLVTIRFQPTTVVSYNGKVEIISDSPTTPDYIYIGGIGVSAELSFAGEDVHVHTNLYSFISIPYVLGSSRTPTSANQITTVLKNLGSYNPNKWRLFQIKNNQYLEYPDFIPADSLFFKPGIAFWLIANDAVELNLQNVTATPATTGTGINTTVANYRITLKPKWNMIGNPFAYSVQWSDILNTTSITSTSIQAPVVYNVKWKESNGLIEPYSYNISTLEPWRGYFVYNRTSSNIVIQVPPFQSIPKTAGPREFADNEFILKVHARGIDSKLRTSRTTVGMLNSAQDGIDDNDYYEAPPIGDYLQLSVIEGKNRFAGNFKAVSSSGAFWDLSLSASGKKEPAEITLDGLQSLQKDFKIWLLDQDRECLVPLQNGKAQMEIDGAGKARRLRLIVGTEEFAKGNNEAIPLVAYRFELLPLFPNPFNPETHIEYHLAEKSNVALEIYNVLGQKVRTLVRGTEETGVHHEVWDGRDDAGRSMNSGVYFCRIRTEKFALSKKMILIR